jgi:hypothetical protein
MAWLYSPDARGRERGERSGPRRPRHRARLAPALLLALVLSACASAPPLERPPAPAARAEFAVGRDTFAFPNLVRANTPDRPVEFANYCIVMVRGASQFFRFARFAPGEPPRPDAEYTRLTREVLAITPWEAPWPAERRLVIPGYPDLHTFSRARESAIKAAFGNQWPSIFAFRNWRVTWWQSRAHQAGLAHELVEEVGGGRTTPLLITSFPEPDYLNHVVLVYDYRPSAGVVEFLAYDPNDPDNPLSLHFDPASRAFWIEAVPYGPAGRIRAFRLFGSPLL